MIKPVVMGFGFFSFALGLIGIFMPIMPTVPFLIVAAACFSYSSKKWHDWLVNHKVLGPPVNDWNKGQVIRKKAKIIATIALICGIPPIWFLNVPLWTKISHATIIVAVLIFVLTRPGEAKGETTNVV